VVPHLSSLVLVWFQNGVHFSQFKYIHGTQKVKTTLSDVTKVRIEKKINENVVQHVDEFDYKSKREFVQEAVKEKMQRDRDTPSTEERIKRLEEAIDLDTS